MIARVFGGAIRGALVVVAVGTPALLLPDVSVAAQEISLIVAGLAAAFTLFEYASTHPGLVDFRFAPPYNRVRFFAFAAQIFALSLLCRNHGGLDGFGDMIAQVADVSVAIATVPLSPVGLVVARLPEALDPEEIAFLTQVASVSLVLSLGLMILFGGFLWLIKWPVGRRDFNLWINLPTFSPGYATDVERRLYRDAVVNLVAGLVVAYGAPILLLPFVDLADPAVHANYQLVLWSATLWGFISGSLFIRGMALMKVWVLVRRARLL